MKTLDPAAHDPLLLSSIDKEEDSEDVEDSDDENDGLLSSFLDAFDNVLSEDESDNISGLHRGLDEHIITPLNNGEKNRGSKNPTTEGSEEDTTSVATSTSETWHDPNEIVARPRKRVELWDPETIERIHDLCREGDVEQLDAVLGAVEIDLKEPMEIACNAANLDVLRCVVSHSEDERFELLNYSLEQVLDGCTMMSIYEDSDSEDEEDLDEDEEANQEERRARELQVVQCLIELGADAKRYMFEGNCFPLVYAICNNRVDLARCLVQAGADVNGPTRQCDENCWALESACENAGLEMIQFLVQECGAQVNHVAPDGATPLTYVADCSDWKMMDWLITDGHADPNLGTTVEGYAMAPPIIAAARENRVETIKLLIEVGKAKVTLCDDDGDTALTMAAMPQYFDPTPEAQLKTVELLVKAGANANAQNKNGTTALHRACEAVFVHRPRMDLVKYLVLEAGADVTTKDNDGRTAFIVALSSPGQLEIAKFLHDQNPELTKSLDMNVDNGRVLFDAVRHSDIEALAFLLENTNVDVRVRDEEGRLPIHLARNADIVRMLLRAGAHVNDTDRQDGKPGRSLLHYACCELGDRYLYMIGKLVSEFVANVDLRDERGNTPLHRAAKHGSLCAARCLILGGGAHPMLADADGRTPLHRAAEAGHVNVLDFLLQQRVSRKRDVNGMPVHYQVDVNAQDNIGRTPLSYASAEEEQVAVHLLIKRGGASALIPDLNGALPLHYAATNGCLDIVKFLVQECPVDVNARDENLETAVWKACHAGDLNVVKWLFDEAGADLDLCDKHGEFPIHIACRRGHCDIVEWMVCHHPGCVNLRNENGELPLHLASLLGDVDVAMYLLSLGGSSIHASDNKGREALHTMFCGRASVGFTRLLVEIYSADVKTSDTQGNTPLHLALLNRRVDSAEEGQGKTDRLIISPDGENITEEIFGDVVDDDDESDFSDNDEVDMVWFGEDEEEESDDEDNSFSEIVSILLDRFPRVTMRNEQGENVLFLACGDAGVDTQTLYRMVHLSVSEGLFQ